MHKDRDYAKSNTQLHTSHTDLYIPPNLYMLQLCCNYRQITNSELKLSKLGGIGFKFIADHTR